MSTQNGSPAFTISREDLLKVGKGALIAAAGAVCAFGAQYLSGHDFGQYSFVAVAIASVLVNLAHKWGFPQEH